jgi:hypothetical protein
MTQDMSNQTRFYIAGDSLEVDTPSYVVRRADHELLDNIQAGTLCYVLSARQMGKSSLMVRTANILQHQGIRTVLIDLNTIGRIAVDEWYLGFLVHVKRQLQLANDFQEWWHGKHRLGVSQRFVDFLRDVVLAEIPGQIVLFIDEIDVMLQLEFRDDFFAAIRAMSHARARDPIYNRLTFVLLGVATPIDLARDAKRTPFNIGRRILLYEFSYSEAAPLRQGLEVHYPGQSDRILRRIFYWTNGHPYLTQKLCLAITAERHLSTWNDAQIDRLVEDRFFSDRGARDANLTCVRDSIAGIPEDERREMLTIYENVYHGQSIADDESSPAQNHLELFGLVRIERGKLHVRNRIYRRMFGERWIKEQLPKKPRSFFLPIIVVLLALALLGEGSYIFARSTGLFGNMPTSIAIVDSPTVVLTLLPVIDQTPIVSTPQRVTSDLPTPAPPTLERPTGRPTSTAAPTAISTAAPAAAPTMTLSVGVVRCTVQDSGVTIHTSPNDNTNIGTLARGTTFVPEAKSTNDATYVWVKLPGSGWVYAGTSRNLVTCIGL